MPTIGPMEIGIVLLIALLVFGPKKLPELGRGMGTGLREFKQSVTDAGKELKTPLLEGGATESTSVSSTDAVATDGAKPTGNAG